MGRSILPVSGTADRLQVNPRPYSFREDFATFASGGLWTALLQGGATIGTATPGVGQITGVLTLSTIDSLVNRECYVKTTIDQLALAARAPLAVECALQFNEASNGATSIIAFGLMSAVAAQSMQDNTGEPKTSFTGAVIYKTPGVTTWKTCSSVGTAQTKSISTSPAGGQASAPDNAFHRLRIEISPIDGSQLAEVTYYFDGAQMRTASARPGLNKIKDQLSYAGALPMGIFLCCKNGDTMPESMNVNWIDVRGVDTAT